MMLREFLSFLKRPNDRTTSNFQIVGVLKTLGYWFSIYILFTILMAIFQMILKQANLLPDHSNSFKNMSLSFNLIILAPICEELLFRLILRYSKLNLALFLSTVIYFVLHKAFDFSKPYSLLCAVFVLSGLFYTLIQFDFKGKLETIWEKNTTLLFYLSAFVFGIVHLNNFTGLRPIHFLLFPVIVGNQIGMGLVLGFLRLKYKNGTIVSGLLHILINLPILLLSRL